MAAKAERAGAGPGPRPPTAGAPRWAAAGSALPVLPAGKDTPPARRGQPSAGRGRFPVPAPTSQGPAPQPFRFGVNVLPDPGPAARPEAECGLSAVAQVVRGPRPGSQGGTGHGAWAGAGWGQRSGVRSDTKAPELRARPCPEPALRLLSVSPRPAPSEPRAERAPGDLGAGVRPEGTPAPPECGSCPGTRSPRRTLMCPWGESADQEGESPEEILWGSRRLSWVLEGSRLSSNFSKSLF